MAQTDLFLLDALSALGKACLRQFPKGLKVNAMTLKPFADTSTLPQSRVNDLQAIAESQYSDAVLAAREAKQVVFASDLFYRTQNQDQLQAYAKLIKSAYDACLDDVCRCFIFVSTAAVYDNSCILAEEDDPTSLRAPVAETALDVEKYLLNASANRRLKPIILRAGTPYGPSCPSIVLILFQQITAIATLRATLPRFYRGPRTQLVHIDDLARAVSFFLLLKKAPYETCFNVVDDESLRIGELFAIAAKTTQIPIQTSIIFPHAAGLPWAIRALEKWGILGPLELGVAAAWRHIQYCYGLDPTPVPQFLDFINACAWPKVDNARIKREGFEFLYPSFKRSADEVYEDFKHSHWIPDHLEAPCRRGALLNRVQFKQTWRGFLVSQKTPNTQQAFVMTIDNDAPFWATHSFSSAPFSGYVTIENGQQVPISGLRHIRHISDTTSLQNTTLTLNLDGKDLKFVPIEADMQGKGPYLKFTLNDDHCVHYTGKITIDLTPKAIIEGLLSLSFAKN